MSKRFVSIWDAIENTPAEAANMRARAELMTQLVALIKKRGWTQTEAAVRLDVTQPRVSDLMRGKIDLFSIDSLLNMIERTGARVELRIKSGRERQVVA